jgi:hypothetical protein
MKKIKESITTDLKNEINSQIMSIPSFNINPVEAMKDINAYNKELGEQETEEIQPDFYKLVYNPEDKTAVGAYLITGETDKTIEVLNLIERLCEISTFLDNVKPYSFIPHKVKLPKSQIEIIGDVEGKEGFKFIKIPYWLVKKSDGKLNISRIEGKKRYKLTKNQGKEEFMRKLNDPDIEKALKVIGDDNDVETLKRYHRYYDNNFKKKDETTEATSSGASGQYSQPLFSTTKKEIEEKWSKKYKNSIDCKNPKGFSQKDHCQSREKIKENELKGGLSDDMTFYDIAKKHDKKGYYDIEDFVSSLKKQLQKGIKVELEHTNDDKVAKEIAMDHLFEDPNYYDKLKKIEATEATSTASSGQYSTPAFVAKNSKNWRGGKKPLFPGGKFVKVKDKCKKFPYCNQGDIKALKLTENNWEKEAKNNIDKTFENMPKLKDLKEYGLKYSVKSLKNLLLKKTRPDGTYGDNKWKREEMPFPKELDILNVLFQSRLAKYYFTDSAKKKDKYHYDFANLITKESLDNFPIPESIFHNIVETLTKPKDGVIDESIKKLAKKYNLTENVIRVLIKNNQNKTTN